MMDHDGSVRKIEQHGKAAINEVANEANEEYAKAITRSTTRSLFTSNQYKRRASPRINAKPLTTQGNGARGQIGHQNTLEARKLKSSLQSGMGDAKHPPQPHQ